MKKYLLPQSGNFYKANLHMHTNISDGQMSPEEVKEVYTERGYSIVAFTDHEVMVPHNDLSDDGFLAITSYEAATNSGSCPGGFDFEQTYHLNLYSLDKNKNVSPVFEMARLWPPHSIQYMSEEAKAVNWHREYSAESINAFISKANEEGFLVSYNHPVWSTQRYADYADLKGLWGVEWYNTGCERAGYHDTMQPIDDLLSSGEHVFPLATDDAHASKKSLHDCFGGYTMIKAEQLEYDTVMQALINGDFYSTTGPEIKELYLEDGILHISTSPAADITVTTERRTRCKRQGKVMTETEIDISRYINTSKEIQQKRAPSYFRITVTDAHGNQAQTRAFFENDWE